MELPDDVKKTVSFAHLADNDVVTPTASTEGGSTPVSVKNKVVKNTFIHLEPEDDEQPSLASRSVSGPGKLQLSQLYQQAEREEAERERLARIRESWNDPELEGQPLSREIGVQATQAPIAPISPKTGQFPSAIRSNPDVSVGSETASEEKARDGDKPVDGDDDQPTIMRRNLSGPVRPTPENEPMLIPMASDPSRKEEKVVEREKSLILTRPPASQVVQELPAVDEDCSPLHPQTKIKNTFVHLEADCGGEDDDEEQPTVTRRAVSDMTNARKKPSDRGYSETGKQLAQLARNEVASTMQRNKSPAGPVGSPAKIAIQGEGEPPQRNGDLEAVRDDGNGTQAAYSHWPGLYKDNAYPDTGFAAPMLPGPAGMHPPPGVLPPPHAGIPPGAFIPPPPNPPPRNKPG
jgi:hypothetical protein